MNSTFLQPFLSYTTWTHTTFGFNTESTYDWENTKWTVPLNAFTARLVNIGKLPLQFTLGPKLYVTGPMPAPDWGIRFVTEDSPPDRVGHPSPGHLASKGRTG